MSRYTVHRIAEAPRAGSEVWISPAAGVHGRGSFWAMVVSSTPALIAGAAYLRVVPTDDIDGDAVVRTFYDRLSGLLVREPR